MHGIRFEYVIDLIPKKLEILYRTKNHPYFDTLVLPEKEFRRFKFELIKWLKKRPRPEDRVMRFECLDEQGHFLFELEEKLIESRTTRKEKMIQQKKEEQIAQMMKERGIE